MCYVMDPRHAESQNRIDCRLAHALEKRTDVFDSLFGDFIAEIVNCVGWPVLIRDSFVRVSLIRENLAAIGCSNRASMNQRVAPVNEGFEAIMGSLQLSLADPAEIRTRIIYQFLEFASDGTGRVVALAACHLRFEPRGESVDEIDNHRLVIGEDVGCPSKANQIFIANRNACSIFERHVFFPEAKLLMILAIASPDFNLSSPR